LTFKTVALPRWGEGTHFVRFSLFVSSTLFHHRFTFHALQTFKRLLTR